MNYYGVIIDIKMIFVKAHETAKVSDKTEKPKKIIVFPYNIFSTSLLSVH